MDIKKFIDILQRFIGSVDMNSLQDFTKQFIQLRIGDSLATMHNYVKDIENQADDEHILNHHINTELLNTYQYIVSLLSVMDKKLYDYKVISIINSFFDLFFVDKKNKGKKIKINDKIK